jgi:hypothetical protein
MVRRAVIPHVLVDHELVAALEQVQERDRAVPAVTSTVPSRSTIGGGPRARSEVSVSR